MANLDAIEKEIETFVSQRSLTGGSSSEALESLFLDDVTESDIRRALDRLPSEDRRVLLMSFVQRMSYREISHALRCSVKAVTTRMHHARRLMQSCLLSRAGSRDLLPDN